MKSFSWDVTAACNFGCSYCSYPIVPASDAAPMEQARVVAAWQHVHALYGPCRLYLTGGEPLCVPGIADVIHALTQRHHVHITSNLSCALEDLIARIDPGKLVVNATYHPLHMDHEFFKDQVLALRRAGFTCGACYLAHPQQVREMPWYAQYFLRHGISLAVTRFYGVYDGRQYPQAYTPEENALIELVGMNDRAHMSPAPRAASLPRMLGADCAAGYAYANVDRHGVVRRCGHQSLPLLGNILMGTMCLWDAPAPCPRADDCTERTYCQGDASGYER